ncbi:MAG: LysR substrate-binding domain-containing protein [Sphingopyxis sp.]|uniref:LysR family transcriptional regulator n=1 Tax=Sphingopyxis sp. TaxID=1908224 RepID=UPI002AB812B2|nr:LysR substrate-binding domain-containing protein [Sphingopyxis sp.]MDZ3831643.1 LysR substrate-binding domain-containing protein [Sphingopyxis sp.]
MRLRHIEVFHAVYEHGSVTEAARALNVSQPSVSKVLRHAEDQLGYILFRREKGRLIPTEPAHELFLEVSAVYTQLGRLSRTARNLGTRRGGHLRIAALPSIGLSIGPRAIARFREKQPDVSFEITTLHSRDVERSLYEHECDVAIGYHIIRQTHLVQVGLGSAGLLLVTPKGQFGEDGAALPMSILHGTDFVGLRDSGPLADIFANELSRLDISPREIATAHTYYAAIALVREGLGITVADEFTVAAFKGDTLSAYRLTPAVRTPVSAITLDRPAHAELIEGFVEEVSRVIAEEGRLGTP